MTNVVLIQPKINDYLSGKIISAVQKDSSQLLIKTKSEVGLFISWNGKDPHISRVISHREYMMSPLYGFEHANFSRYLVGFRVTAALTDGKHLIIQKTNGELTWLNWDISLGVNFVKQDAHADLFGHGLEGIMDILVKRAYQRRQV